VANPAISPKPKPEISKRAEWARHFNRNAPSLTNTRNILSGEGKYIAGMSNNFSVIMLYTFKVSIATAINVDLCVYFWPKSFFKKDAAMHSAMIIPPAMSTNVKYGKGFCIYRGLSGTNKCINSAAMALTKGKNLLYQFMLVMFLSPNI
jgi:hypothetical protein